jgi:SAM-dependent methyltransferase
MPTWRREAEALIAETLGVPAAHWVEWDEALPAPGSAFFHLVLSVVGHAAPSVERVRVLARIGEVLTPEGTLVVVDHNRPRRSVAAFRAVLGAPRVPGASPARRWRRLAHPTAREVQGAGFRVDRLRFAAGERIQIVIAKRGRG